MLLRKIPGLSKVIFLIMGVVILASTTLLDAWSTYLITKKFGWKVELNPAVAKWHTVGFPFTNLFAVLCSIGAFFFHPLVYVIYFLAGGKAMVCMFNFIQLRK